MILFETFEETVFYKEESDLQNKYEALKKLNEEYPNNEELIDELYIVKKGLEGENEITYELKKAHIGMYVLRDVKVKYEDLTAQIDYVIITQVYIYLVECKNLVGNITVTDKGDFIREYSINGKKIKKGMYSPLRQVEAQREVLRKIWNNKTSKIKKFFASKKFNYYRRLLVVAANQDTILNTDKAPKDIKYKILRADGLIKQIEYDLNNRERDEPLESKKSMEEIAKSYDNICIKENIDYYQYYKDKYCNKSISKEELKNKLIEFRKSRAKEVKKPPYYIFDNKELDKLVELVPKTLEELNNSKILQDIKIKCHGKAIIEELKKLT